MSDQSTRAIYDANANSWARNERLLLSDFTARPRVVAELQPKGQRILDLGCGEGYVARLVASAGAASIVGVDASSEMIAKAREAANGPCPMSFEVDDVRRRSKTSLFGDDATYDRAMAVFLFNYLTYEEMWQVMRYVRLRLTEQGRFVFTVPHPCFPYMREPAAPFYFDTEGRSYLGGVGQTYEGKIWRRDGVDVPVRCVHKTWTDYFYALRVAGFVKMPKVIELAVTEEHIAYDPDFFGPLRGYPLHVLFSVEAP